MNRTPTPTPTQRRDPLTDEQRAENKRALSRKYNRKHRLLYLTVDPTCAVCCKRLLLCECPAPGAVKYERAEVVQVLNVKTMKKSVKVI
jgi:hypothetical protein